MKIGVVIVTYNRLKKLKETLMKFSCQTIMPEYILIINNASTDQTTAFLEEWESEAESYKKVVINMKENAGGSGGFSMGLRESLNLEAEWVWVSDDDAVPEVNAIEEAYNYLQQNDKRLDRISAICGMVINNGKIDTKHRKNYINKGIFIKEEPILEDEYNKKEFELNAFSYVGTIISREKMRQIGVTRAEYFIWWDDTEHSLRLSKIGKILCVPNIKIHHDIGEDKFSVTWKTYYGFRNMTDMYHRHMPKYCFWYFCIKIRIKLILYSILGIRKMEMKFLNEGFQDALNGNFGIHPLYRPGWKP